MGELQRVNLCSLALNNALQFLPLSPDGNKVRRSCAFKLIFSPFCRDLISVEMSVV